MDGFEYLVLLITDDPSDVELLATCLSRAEADKFSLESADGLSTGIARLREGGVDAVILDMALCEPVSNRRGYGSPEECDAKQSLHDEDIVEHGAAGNRRQEFPSAQYDGNVILDAYDDLCALAAVVLLTHHQGEPLAIQGTREGGQDYLIRERMTTDLLERTLRHAILRHRAIHELRESLAQQIVGMSLLATSLKRELELLESAHVGVANRLIKNGKVASTHRRGYSVTRAEQVGSRTNDGTKHGTPEFADDAIQRGNSNGCRVSKEHDIEDDAIKDHDILHVPLWPLKPPRESSANWQSLDRLARHPETG